MRSNATQLLQAYKEVRNQSSVICEPLHPEDYTVQPIVDVSPPKWHLAHTTWFFENFILVPNMKGYKVCDDDYNYLFNSYYESVGQRVLRADRGYVSRPGVEEVIKYREYVDQAMEQYLLGFGEEVPADIEEVLRLGLQHEQQHQELLVYDIKYILGNNPIYPAYDKLNQPGNSDNAVSPADFVEIPEGIYSIGHEKDSFCFDNELGGHKVFLHTFRVMNRLVTNGEYLEFVEAGGYKDFKYWLSEGWEWVKQHQVVAPFYWQKQDNKWYYYKLKGGLQPVDLNEPVTHISMFEADAYASWKGKRLLTEFEWEAASKSGLLNDLKSANFAEDRHYGPVPQQKGSTQFYGDVWEWTNSAYLPYPYYQAAPGALGEYNGKFMVNQMVLRGGSCATPRNHIRNTYRNFFHPHLRWLFTGIRLAESV